MSILRPIYNDDVHVCDEYCTNPSDCPIVDLEATLTTYRLQQVAMGVGVSREQIECLTESLTSCLVD